MFIWKPASISSGFWNFSSFPPWKSQKSLLFPSQVLGFPRCFQAPWAHPWSPPWCGFTWWTPPRGTVGGSPRGSSASSTKRHRATLHGEWSAVAGAMAHSPGELWDNLWKIMGKMTILVAQIWCIELHGPVSIAMLVYRRVAHVPKTSAFFACFCWWFCGKPPKKMGLELSRSRWRTQCCTMHGTHHFLQGLPSANCCKVIPFPWKAGRV